MKTTRSLVSLSLAFAVFAVLAGCASSKVTQRQSNLGADEKLARPGMIFVYDFAATADDLAPGVADAAAYSAPSTPPSPEEIETGRKLGVEVADQLTVNIRAMGLSAHHASANTTPSVGDLVIHGHFASIEEGSRGKRLVVGFGSGNADLQTVVETFEVTPSGLRKLGSGTVDSGSGKTPGMLLPIAVTVATANPVGLLVGGAVKVAGEVSGKDTIEGAAKRTSEQIAEALEEAFKKQGWI
jgi:hypothetical protein